jgi:glycosyltransferase involved in cell wall biosynthesis
MKILIYAEYFFPIPGGVQTVVFELARGLAQWAADHPGDKALEVTVVTRTQERTPQDQSWPFRLVRRPRLRRLLRLIRAADMIHLAGPGLLPMAICFLLRKPVVIEHHGFQAACPNGLLFFEPAQALCPGYFMARRYDRCLACNRSAVGAWKSCYWLALTPVRRWLSNRASKNVVPTNWLGSILKLNRTTTIYHGVPEADRRGGHNSCNSVFAFQGRLVTTKGVSVLLDAMRLLLRDRNRGLELKIIGDGPELPILKSGKTAFDGRVEFLGHLGENDLDNELSRAATVVMPSLGGEVFGLVAAENMMRSKVLIVSDIGALQEVVGDTGLVFPAKDSPALAECMRRVLDDPAWAGSLGAAARERAMRVFSLANMIRAHLLCYQEVVRR